MRDSCTQRMRDFHLGKALPHLDAQKRNIEGGAEKGGGRDYNTRAERSCEISLSLSRTFPSCASKQSSCCMNDPTSSVLK
jgi:hypothetical protein